MNKREFRLLPHAMFGYRGKSATLVLSLLLLISVFAWVEPTTAQEPLEPPSTPNAESALPIFNERCANCHGLAGHGDGELAPNLPAPPRDYTDSEFLRKAVPAALFQTITEGRLDAGMPPFGPTSSDPLAAEERWNLVAMVYSLGTPPEAIENGRLAYDENCAACHGENGTGDGPQAADQDTTPTDLTDLRYWSSRSNEMVAAAVQDIDIAAHTYALDEEEVWNVVDYSRTFGYDYYDPVAALEPIEAATISGLITNGSSGELLGEGSAVLRAFTRDFEEEITMTAAVGVDGRYTFDLEQVPPDLVYLTSVEYEDLTFNSSPERLERRNPTLNMPITVFDKTSDPAVVNVEQIHLVLEFVDDRVVVSEIYVLSNNDAAVFVGESGAAGGTIEIGLPAGAEGINFQRSFDSFGNFMPAPEMIQTENGWADTVPLRPGESVMNLLVTYDLLYEDGLTFDHPLFYDTSSATVVMPDVGISLEGDEWLDQGVQQMGSAGAFNSYGHPNATAGESLSFELQGKAARAATSSGNPTLSGDTITGLLIGAGVLLLVGVGAVFTVRSWQNPGHVDDGDEKEQLLQALVDLDDAFEAGKLDEADYQQRRQNLMTELVDIWQA